MNKQQGPPPPYSVAPSQPPTIQLPPTVIVQPAATVSIHHDVNIVGPSPQAMVCPSCNATICTSIRHEPTTKTHLTALLLFLCGCWLCCCLPYCMDSCQNGNHYCPNCGSFIGTYHS